MLYKSPLNPVMDKSLKIKINKKGEIRIEYIGYQGKTCEVAEKRIKQKLDTIAKSLGINSSNKSEDELRSLISGKIGKQNQTTESEKSKSVN